MRVPSLVRSAARAAAIVAATGVAGLTGTLGLAGMPSAQAAQADNIRASQQWVLDAVSAPTAWEQSEGAGVTVAVLDSGVNGSVSDLSGSVISGPDLTGLSTPPGNANWGVHGTWMASIIAGHGHDGGNDGIMGIAPEARILSIRVIPEKTDPGYKTYDAEPEERVQQSLATGIRDAVKDGAQVISMSLGYTTPSAVVRSAIQYAFDHGVVLVASSGNSGKNDSSGASGGSSPTSASSSALSSASAVSEFAGRSSAARGSAVSAGSDGQGSGFAPDSFPAEYPGVLSVGALQENGTVASFSSNNLSVRVGAPGNNVPAEGRDGQYWLVSGTSPACAVTAGVAALIKSKYRGLSAADVDQSITSSAQNNPAGSYNAESGFGEADASAALQEAGVLAAAKSAGSQVASSVQFGGGSSADPAAPVAPRGIGSLILFSIVAAVSLVVAGGAGLRARRARRAAAVAGAGAGAGGLMNGTGGMGGTSELSGTDGRDGGGAPDGYHGTTGASAGSYGSTPAYPSPYQQQAPASPPPGYTRPAGYPQPDGRPESPAYPRSGSYGQPSAHGQPGVYPGQADEQARGDGRRGSGGQYRAGHYYGDDSSGNG